MALHKPKTPDDVRRLLHGRVNSIPTPFLADGEIDWDGVANIIETGIAAGSNVALLTAGDSQYSFLTEKEIARLTRFVIQRVAGRVLTVAATGAWATRQAVQFAGLCRDAGADVLMSLPPQQINDAKGLAGHYRAIAQVVPVMIVGCPPHAMLDRLLDEPGICCFKEDGSEAYAIHTIQKYGAHWKIMTGGSLWRHLSQWPFGCRAFMDWSASFAPHVGESFLEALRVNDPAAAAEVVRAVETPLFSLAGIGVPSAGGPGFPGGWQALWRAALELTGIASRYLRPPQVSASDEDLERIRPTLSELGLLRSG